MEIPGPLDSATQDRIQAAAKLEFRAVLLAGAPDQRLGRQLIAESDRQRESEAHAVAVEVALQRSDVEPDQRK